MKFKKKNFFIWLAIFVTLFATLQFVSGSNRSEKEAQIPYSDFIKLVDSEDVEKVKIKGRILLGITKSGDKFSTYLLQDQKLVEKLLDNKVTIQVMPPESEISFLNIFINWLPLLLLIGLGYLTIKSFQSGGNRGFGLGKSKAKVSGEKDIKVTFDDVAGIEEAKAELQEIVEFLKNPKKFEKLGGKIPRGVLLSGAPGNGKTLLARAIAGEAGVIFFNISGSDFVEMFVGVGASRVRDMFDQAKKNSPCIIFIDEIDAVARKRSHSMHGGHEEREQTLNQLLVEMDGFEQNQGIIIIGATNRPDILDKALLRPGRFDRRISVSFPDVNGREKILKVHTKKVPLYPEVDLRMIARGTPGFSGADLANLVNEAAIIAAKNNELAVSQADLESAKDKIIMGTERKSWLLNEKERSNTAHHEAGHAVVAFHVKGSKPIHKVTIIPRGNALGMLVQLPEDDQLTITKEEMLASIMVSMGGRIAEEIFFGENGITSGAASDILHATNICRQMVIEWGLTLDPKKNIFQNYSIVDPAGYRYDYDLSQETLKKLDAEVEKIINYCYDKAKKLLTEKKDEIALLAKYLLKEETLDFVEVKSILEKGKLPRKKSIKLLKPSRRIPTTEKQGDSKKKKSKKKIEENKV